MKINDKTLISIAKNGDHIDKEGYLLKKGEVNRGYQKRWFVLKGNMLFYFEKPTDKEPIGVIFLEDCRVELSADSLELDRYTFQIVFPGSNSRTYMMSADTQETMEEWMKALSSSGYEFMKLLVLELQRKLEETAIAENSCFTDAGSTSITDPNSGRLNSIIPSERFNPFNTQTSLYDLDDDWHQTGLSSFNRNSSTQPYQTAEPQGTRSSQIVQPKSGSRTFLQMHEEFGVIIRPCLLRIHES